jgi:hypothetical protein
MLLRRAVLAFVLVPLVGACAEDPCPAPKVLPPTCVLSTVDIDLGEHDCGGTSPSEQILTILNVGTQILVYQATLEDTRVFRIASQASGVIAPGTEGQIRLSVNPAAPDAVAGAEDSTLLILVSNDPQRPRLLLPVRRRTRGATLVAAAVDFGDVPSTEGRVTRGVAISNVGNRPARVALAAPTHADFSVSWAEAPSPVLIEPGQTWQGATVHFTPRSIGHAEAEMPLVARGAVCGTVAPMSLRAHATRGLAVVSPLAIDFGDTPCGQLAAPREVDLRNAGTGAFTFVASLGRSDSPYQLSTAQGTVPPGTTLRLVVSPRPIPSRSDVTRNRYGDTLTLTTSAPGDTPHVVDLYQTASGAILEFAVDQVVFGKQAAASQAQRSVLLTNRGNQGAYVALQAVPPFSVSEESTYLPAGGTLGRSVRYSALPSALGQTQSAALTIATLDALCAPRPSLPLSGTPIDDAGRLAVGQGFVCLLAQSGTVYCWGENRDSDTKGSAGHFRYAVPTPIPSAAGALDLVAGADHVCVLTGDHTVACWGQGPLGHGIATSSLNAVPVAGLTDVIALTSGDRHICALLGSGQIACLGDNHEGQLGDGTRESRATPVPVALIGDEAAIGAAIGAGSAHTCAALQSGDVWCWGAGYGDVPVPRPVSAELVTGGGDGTCALSGGQVTCWDSAPSTPFLLPALDDALTVARGAGHACAIRATGGALCWGANDEGQLGDGSGQAWPTQPVVVARLSQAMRVAAHGTTSCATTSVGQVACWGALAGDPDGGGWARHSLTPTYIPGFE